MGWCKLKSESILCYITLLLLFMESGDYELSRFVLVDRLIFRRQHFNRNFRNCWHQLHRPRCEFFFVVTSMEVTMITNGWINCVAMSLDVGINDWIVNLSYFTYSRIIVVQQEVKHRRRRMLAMFFFNRHHEKKNNLQYPDIIPQSTLSRNQIFNLYFLNSRHLFSQCDVFTGNNCHPNSKTSLKKADFAQPNENDEDFEHF